MPPNILLFSTDDHGAWALHANGNSEVHSPILDTLALQGTRFTNAFTPSPVCSPARACLQTGRTPSQVGIHDWLEENDPTIGARDWLKDEITLPELLATTGYHCGLAGKWHLGLTHQTPRGFAWCFGLPGHQGGHIGPYTYHLNGTPLTLTGNKTEIITTHALDFLAQTPTTHPFFLNVSFISTHSPYAGQDPALVALYRNATFRDIPPYDPHPWRKNEGFTNDLDFNPHLRRDACANYYAAVTDIDRNVGRLLAALNASGQRRNTLIIYTSDHGLTLGHHGFWGKGNSTRPLNMYDTSLRIPLLWQGPGITQNQVIANCTDHYDTFQTLTQLAGAKINPAKNYPGHTYQPLLQHQPIPNWDNTRYGEYGDLRMIRTPDWKLVLRHPLGPHDLFHLHTDPAEKTNLANLPQHAAIQSQLTTQLETFYATHSDPAHSGLLVKSLPRHNLHSEAWRDHLRESHGLQIY